VFFLFQEGNVLTPVWKIAYNVKATLPDGRAIVVGSGRSSLKMERSFVVRRVDEAATLLTTVGAEEGMRAIADPASHFNFLGSYVFVLDMQGHTLVDPSFPNMPGRDLSGMTDAIGRNYVQEILAKLAKNDTASTMFFWRANPNDVPQRKAIYARKTTASGTDYIVGTEYLLPTPIWMK
jgi:signal transduction histidine kinase